MRRTDEATETALRAAEPRHRSTCSYDGYDRALGWVLDHQPLTLLVAVATLVLTVLLYVVIPKGFFPVQDTGLIQGISASARSRSPTPPWPSGQQALAAAILKDPDVDSLSSFIGVDGTNTTLNSGRFLINLKPHDQRSATSATVIRRLQREVAGVAGHLALHAAGAGPDDRCDGQPHPVPVRAGGRQSGRAGDLDAEAGRAARKQPELEDVASDLQAARACGLYHRRSRHGGRFGITPATVDNALYDAFGQRIISTIFTQSNQYRVILEADPALQQSLQSLDSIYLPSAGARPGAAVDAIATVSEQTAPLQINHLGQFPATTVSFNLAPGASLGEAVDVDRPGGTRDRPAGERASPASRARRSPSRPRSATSCC